MRAVETFCLTDPALLAVPSSQALSIPHPRQALKGEVFFLHAYHWMVVSARDC